MQPETLHLGGDDSPRNSKLRAIARLDDRYNEEWTPAGDIIDDLLDDRLAELDGDSGDRT
ncbi:hypothetical protein [Natrialba magadii]|nr:hypothetical protein [Natrialba magadii]